MKKSYVVFALCAGLILTSCNNPKAGTLVKIGEVPRSEMSLPNEVEVHKYYYDDEGSYVFVSRFKQDPNVITTTWKEQQGKVQVDRANVTIYENDSIKIVRKK